MTVVIFFLPQTLPTVGQLSYPLGQEEEKRLNKAIFILFKSVIEKKKVMN